MEATQADINDSDGGCYNGKRWKYAWDEVAELL